MKCIDEEIPFEVPESWQWERIGNIAFVTKLAGFEYTKYFTKDNILAENTIPLVRAQNVKMGVYHENTQDAIDLALSILLDRCALTKKCLLMTFIGAGIGDVCIFPNNKRSHLAPNVAKIEFYSNLSLEYALIYLMSSTGQQEIVNIRKSTAQPSLSMATIRNILIPVPPVNEQIRIQENANTFFTLTTDIERDKFELEQFIKQAKSKILDLAIRGKLVPQDPNDEPASVLLERIKSERPENKKKVKDISDNSHYTFSLPESWVWCRLEDVCGFENGFAFSSNDYKTIGIPLIRISNIIDGSIELNNCVYIDESEFIPQRYQIEKGDLLIAMSGATTGKMGIYKSIDPAYLNQRVGCIKSKNNQLLSNLYRNYFLLLQTDEILKLAHGGAQPNISSNKINSIEIPLPPINEQRRIVKRIEEIFASLDEIANSIKA